MNLDWEKALKIIAEKVSRHNYDTWFKPLRVVAAEDQNLTLGVPNKFFREWLVDNHYSTIRDALKECTGADITFDFSLIKETKVGPQREQSGETPAPTGPTSRKNPVRRINPALNHNYTFERFVVGTSNQFAHAASISVAEKPANDYNPLFIYGGVGLGKTHLLNAIGHHTLGMYPQMNVIYISAEEFMNELINCIRFDKMPKFREKYRHIGCLLIDDIQFIAGKERTQEEFFHTFNTLHDSGKQIVVTSDKFPKDIPNLESRLRSRFEWGLIADIQPPEMETKIAIIEKKAQENKIALPLNISLYIATQAESNIRELEGYLTRIAAFSSVTGRSIDLPLVKEVLKKVLKERKKEDVTIDEILKLVSVKLGVRISDIKSINKNKNFVQARQLCMYLARKHTSNSYPDIGEKIGGRDHSTVIYAYNKVAKALEADNLQNRIVMEIEEGLISR